MGIGLKGTCRFRGKGKAKSPLLTTKGRQWGLSLPEQFEPPKPVKGAPDRVLTVDAQGTVHTRGFISRTDKGWEYRLMNRIRQAAKKHARHGSRLPPGFCRRDYQRLTHLADIKPTRSVGS